MEFYKRRALLVPVAGASQFLAVTGAEAKFGTDLNPQKLYLFTCEAAVYLKQGAVAVASVGAGSMLVPGLTPVLIDGAQGAKLSTIAAGLAANATLQELTMVQ